MAKVKQSKIAKGSQMHGRMTACAMDNEASLYLCQMAEWAQALVDLTTKLAAVCGSSYHLDS